MNNYTIIQKWLHYIVLSSQTVRETTFDLGNLFNRPYEFEDNHVFITGLARSGTTALLNALNNSNELASLSYKDMPFILAPGLWSRISRSKKSYILTERAHGDGIKISSDSPEAFEEVFWKTFKHVNQKEIEISFKEFVSQIIFKEGKERYLSKNNQNIKRIILLDKIFPNSKKLVPFRDPLQQAFSLLTQHKNFVNLAKSDRFVSNYMEWVGHTEFGPKYLEIENSGLSFNDPNDINHWLAQWLTVYGIAKRFIEDKENTKFVCYQKLCADAKSWDNIQNFIKVENKKPISFKESIKKFSLPIDKKLLDSCDELYNNIKYKSL